MKILLAILLTLFAAFVQAAPFVEADVGAAVTSCGVFLDAAAKTTLPVTAPVPPATQVKCRVDVGTVAAGSHTIKLTAIQTDAAWGTLESAQSSPFAFVRPAAPSPPASLQIVP